MPSPVPAAHPSFRSRSVQAFTAPDHQCQAPTWFRGGLPSATDRQIPAGQVSRSAAIVGWSSPITRSQCSGPATITSLVDCADP